MCGVFFFADILNNLCCVLTIRRDDAQVKARELGVVFRNLRVVGMGASSSHQPTLGTVLDPRSILNVIQRIRHPPVRDIISGFEGVVRPGEMLRKSKFYPRPTPTELGNTSGIGSSGIRMFYLAQNTSQSASRISCCRRRCAV